MTEGQEHERHIELVQALDILIGAIEQHCMSDDPDVRKELEQARVTLAKATGESK